MKIGIFILLIDAFYTSASSIWTALGSLSLLNKNNYSWEFNVKLKYRVKLFLVVLDLLKTLQRFLTLCCDIGVDELFLSVVIMLI